MNNFDVSKTTWSDGLVESMKAITTEYVGGHRNFENYRDLLFVLVQKEFKARYKDKALGYIWSIAHPLAHTFVLYFAFGVMMRFDRQDYILVLITAMFPWQWLANCVGSSPRMFVGNASLIKKLNFPRIIIPLAAILNHLVHFWLSIPIIVLFLLMYQKLPSLSWIYGIPILIFIQLIMAFGLSLVFASLNLFLRDLERLVSILMSFIFYCTPIIYPEDTIPQEYHHFIYYNPMAPLMISWRRLFMDGAMEPLYLLVSLAYAIAFFTIGYFIFKKLSWKFAEVV